MRICNNLLLCGPDDKLMGVSCFGKFGQDARHTMASQWLLVLK